METNISKEAEFGVAPKVSEPKRIADLEAILNSDKGIVELELEDGSVIKAKHLGALQYQAVVRKYPIKTDALTQKEHNLLVKAYKRRKDDDAEWLLGLSEDEKLAVKKACEADTDVIPRTAFILSKIAVNPTMTEEQAMGILDSFVDAWKLANFCADIQKQTETPEDDIKNC